MRGRKIIDLVGQKFGMLTVFAIGPNPKPNKPTWLCRCDCGNIKEIAGASLRQNQSKSCGCSTSRFKSESNGTHRGLWFHPSEFKIWMGMKNRCSNPNFVHFAHYGGKGITICERWLGPDGFPSFLADMGPRPSPGHSIDRIDNDGDYCPGNCRWATDKEQANNQSRNRLLTFRGETRTLSEWGEITGLSARTIGNRINKHGWEVERALTQPNRRQLVRAGWANRSRATQQPAPPS